MAKKKKGLQGYKREGKRLIPPMKQLPQMREFSYVNDMLPELIWLGLIHDLAGYQFGAEVQRSIGGTAKEFPERDRPNNYALQKAYVELDADQKAAIVEGLERDRLLPGVRDAIAPLVLLYDGCPLSFLGPPDAALSQEAMIERIKICVGRHLNKTKAPGIMLHGTLFMARLISGKIRIAAHIDIPDLDAVLRDPDGAEAQRAGGFLRTSAAAEWAMLGGDETWARHFWNRNAELSRCELPDLGEDD